MVDERDFQLLANLLKEPLASNEELGRRVRLSGTAVKTRLERLAEEGVFGGLYGIPAPEVFQRQRHVYVFRGERVNATAPNKAIQIDPVVSVHLRQDGNTSEFIHKIPQMIAFLTTAFTLEPGDILSTGTPAGVGGAQVPPRYMKAGQHCRIEIEGLGEINNLVIDEPQSTTLP